MEQLLSAIAQREIDISNDQAAVQVAQQQVDEYLRQQAEFNALYQSRMEARLDISDKKRGFYGKFNKGLRIWQ